MWHTIFGNRVITRHHYLSILTLLQQLMHQLDRYDLSLFSLSLRLLPSAYVMNASFLVSSPNPCLQHVVKHMFCTVANLGAAAHDLTSLTQVIGRYKKGEHNVPGYV